MKWQGISLMTDFWAALGMCVYGCVFLCLTLVIYLIETKILLFPQCCGDDVCDSCYGMLMMQREMFFSKGMGIRTRFVLFLIGSATTIACVYLKWPNRWILSSMGVPFLAGVLMCDQILWHYDQSPIVDPICPSVGQHYLTTVYGLTWIVLIGLCTVVFLFSNYFLDDPFNMTTCHINNGYIDDIHAIEDEDFEGINPILYEPQKKSVYIRKDEKELETVL